MYDGLRRVQQPNDAFTLRMHRAALGEVGHRLGDVEEAADPPGRGSIDDNGVVHAFAGSIGADDALLDLAGEQNVAKAGAIVVANSMAPNLRIARPAKRGCRTFRGIRGTRSRCRRPEPSLHRHLRRPRPWSPAVEAVVRRRVARFPGGPRPPRGERACRLRPTRAPTRRQPWTYRFRLYLTQSAGGPSSQTRARSCSAHLGMQPHREPISLGPKMYAG